MRKIDNLADIGILQRKNSNFHERGANVSQRAWQRMAMCLKGFANRDRNFFIKIYKSLYTFGSFIRLSRKVSLFSIRCQYNRKSSVKIHEASFWLQ